MGCRWDEEIRRKRRGETLAHSVESVRASDLGMRLAAITLAGRSVGPSFGQGRLTDLPSWSVGWSVGGSFYLSLS